MHKPLYDPTACQHHQPLYRAHFERLTPQQHQHLASLPQAPSLSAGLLRTVAVLIGAAFLTGVLAFGYNTATRPAAGSYSTK